MNQLVTDLNASHNSNDASSPTASKKSRLVWLDACRGFTMLLVIFWHLMQTPFSEVSLMNRYLTLFRMPTFLFISGYLMYSSNYSKELLASRSKKRLIQQLYPTILIWLASTYIIGVFIDGKTPSIIAMLYNPFKNGFWFTFVLVELFFIAAPILYLFNKYAVSRSVQVGVFMGIALLCVPAALFLPTLIERSSIVDLIAGVLNLEVLFHYSFFFFLGVLVKCFKPQFEEFCRKRVVLIGAIIAFVLLAGFPTPISNAIVTWRYLLCGIAGLVALISLFIQVSQINHKAVQTALKWLAIVGGATLEIYLLHYLVIGFSKSIIVGARLDAVIDTWWEFPVFFALSVAVAATILLFVKLLKTIKLYPLIFPKR